MTKRYCERYGHDTLVVGRVQRMCRECRRIGDRKRERTDKRLAVHARWYHSKGYLKRLNRTVDQAMQRMEAIFGGR